MVLYVGEKCIYMLLPKLFVCRLSLTLHQVHVGFKKGVGWYVGCGMG